MKKYKFIGFLMILIGNANLFVFLTEPKTYSLQRQPNLFFGSALVIMLGIYIVHLAQKRSIV